ncbi:22156_t:CDS:2, partial [Gigaspora margarita]
IKTILNATSIRKRFAELMEEYDSCMRDLKFTMIVDDNILSDDLVDKVKVLILLQLLEITNFIQALQLEVQQKSGASVVA